MDELPEGKEKKKKKKKKRSKPAQKLFVALKVKRICDVDSTAGSVEYLYYLSHIKSIYDMVHALYSSE